jgi:hypothetical protein
VRGWWFGAAAVMLAVPVLAQAQTQTVSVCGQKVEYDPATPDAGVDAKVREALGVWLGEFTNRNSNGLDYRRCIGLVVETVTSTGALSGKYVFGDTMKMVRDSANFSLAPRVGNLNGRVTSDVLSVTGPTFSYEVRLSGSSRAQGSYNDRYGNGQIWLRRQ